MVDREIDEFIGQGKPLPKDLLEELEENLGYKVIYEPERFNKNGSVHNDDIDGYINKNGYYVFTKYYFHSFYTPSKKPFYSYSNIFYRSNFIRKKKHRFLLAAVFLTLILFLFLSVIFYKILPERTLHFSNVLIYSTLFGISTVSFISLGMFFLFKKFEFKNISNPRIYLSDTFQRFHIMDEYVSGRNKELKDKSLTEKEINFVNAIHKFIVRGRRIKIDL